jgi:DNA-binding NarL/FixJ family response regulator
MTRPDLALVSHDAVVSLDVGPRGECLHVAIADGHALVRAGISALLRAEERIEVVGEAGDIDDLLALAWHDPPDAILIDVDLLGPVVGDTVRMLMSNHTRRTRVIVLVAEETDQRGLEALRAGATGCLVKDTGADELVNALRLVGDGHAALSPGIARRLVDEFASYPEERRPAPEDLEELTPREREVVALVAGGLSNDEIAERLVVSPATAKTHVSRALRKVSARDRAELVTIAYETGLVVPGPQRRTRIGIPTTTLP